MKNKLDVALNLYQDITEGDDADLDRFEVNMDLGEFKKKTYRRIYDSKYKIPMSKK